ncbi:geranylgeranyl pyrophosphate synthetase [Zopfia rhizophila CBS 207.26]|uniref:Geranylgeranyl pyrophosphate synthetase n=1 Tax=Zopfia rhizophila CBS 207.26 TaxID=1314779 RepID=A0A6A6EHY8_9PEZI|nr:geranylgeranyl pyrophosphate synthetase [Zopfia rhizophila CBS 207.26]
MASTTIAEISRLDLQDLSISPVASITDVKHLSSYNWIEAPTPTIAVPGSPPLWSALRLKKDSGLIYIAQNAARHPDSPLEPLFRSLYIANPSFDIRSIDVVTDRNNIRKLLSFIDPGSTRNGLETSTIHVEITKNTAIFCREETATHEFIGPHEFRGFGHEFEKVYTTCQIRGSTGHHRIISYRFGGLNFIVRHETDGYVDACTKIPSSNHTNSKGHGIDSLSGALESLSLSRPNSSPNDSTSSKLIVKEEGQVVPLEPTLEIKTRVFHKPLTVQELAPQLWVSQTPKLVRAYHRKGTFERPEVEDVAAEIKSWEERNQSDLKKLTALIQKIIKMVKGYGSNAVLKYDAKGDKLVVCKVNRRKMLPKDLYSK